MGVGTPIPLIYILQDPRIFQLHLLWSTDESRPKGRVLRASWSGHVDGLGGAESAGARERNGGEAYLSGGLIYLVA